MSEQNHQPPFEWVPMDWPDPMQDLRDKAASGDEMAALIVKSADAAVEAALPEIRKAWEDQWMNPPHVKGGLADLLFPENRPTKP